MPASLSCRVRGARHQAIEISTHQLGAPALRHVAGEGHRPRRAIDRQNGAHHFVLRVQGVVNLEWKKQCRAGKPFDLVFA
jgi:hypothetical protein